jgi:hypothetical protein
MVGTGLTLRGKCCVMVTREEAAEGNANLTPRALPGSGMSEYISRSQFANHLNIHADVKAGSRENGLGAFTSSQNLFAYMERIGIWRWDCG